MAERPLQRLIAVAVAMSCLVSASVLAQTRPKEGDCKPDEVDMGDFCASLPPAVSSEEKDRRRVTRFRGKSMMPGRTGAAPQPVAEAPGPLPVPVKQEPAVSPVAASAESLTGFSVQLGAFSSRELAESIAVSIESPESNLAVIPLERGERVLWALMMGPYPDKPSAIEAQNQIRKDRRFRSAYIKGPEIQAMQETTDDNTDK